MREVVGITQSPFGKKGRLMTSVPDPVKLFILEEVELYRHIYELSALGSGVDLLGVCAEFDRDEVEHAVSTSYPDVLLVGTRKPEAAIIEELKEIRHHHPRLGMVCVFSSFASEDGDALRKLARAGEGGIALFLRQSLDQVEQLLRIVLSVSRGQVVLDPALTRSLFADEPGNALRELTPKEKEILDLVARGHTNTGIARSLFVDVKTVEHHLNSIYGKLKTSGDFDDRHPRVTIARLYLKETGELQAS